MQEIALELLSSSAWPRHLKRMRAALVGRRDAMVDAILSTLPDVSLPRIPAGGAPGPAAAPWTVRNVSGTGPRAERDPVPWLYGG
ncbi:hypothetical protein ACIGJO_07950 [Streptomyces sp. NPDC079020]|uniref:hypothetical protein n=1 Tax=Streptomyces sp. NPDC079020 TaxID=3365722 RepID=UPI0037D9738E